MSWSYRLGSVKGIGIYVHITFLALLGFVGFNAYLTRHLLSDAINGILFIVVLFAIVVMHELSHAMTALKFGIKTRDIILLPIGGMARMERIPENPKHELLIAIAGPMSNLILAFLIYLGLSYFGVLEEGWLNTEFLETNIFVRLFIINVVLAVFNLLPAFPMDGGRVLRALLAFKFEYTLATKIAARVGQMMAVLFAFVGFYVNPFLILIAVFIWIGAGSELASQEFKKVMKGVCVDKLMIRDFAILAPNISIQKVFDLSFEGFQHDFPVMENGLVVGVVSRQDLFKAASLGMMDQEVSVIMRKDFATASSYELVEHLISRLGHLKQGAIPVIDKGQLVGLVTLENLGEYVMLESAKKH